MKPLPTDIERAAFRHPRRGGSRRRWRMTPEERAIFREQLRAAEWLPLIKAAGEEIDRLTKALRSARLAGYHEARDAAAKVAHSKRCRGEDEYNLGYDDACAEIDSAIRALEPPTERTT